MIKYATYEDWKAEAERRFGPDPMRWKFICPVCGHIATAQDYKDVRAPAEAVAYSCIGRYDNTERQPFVRGKTPGPCKYSGGGLVQRNPVQIGNSFEERYFDFAPEQAPDLDECFMDTLRRAAEKS